MPPKPNGSVGVPTRGCCKNAYLSYFDDNRCTIEVFNFDAQRRQA